MNICAAKIGLLKARDMGAENATIKHAIHSVAPIIASFPEIFTVFSNSRKRFHGYITFGIKSRSNSWFLPLPVSF
jgi:hypothetical protein